MFNSICLLDTVLNINFLILMMVFGTQRLREVGNDLAVAIRNFRKGLQEDKDEQEVKQNNEGGTQ